MTLTRWELWKATPVARATSLYSSRPFAGRSFFTCPIAKELHRTWSCCCLSSLQLSSLLCCEKTSLGVIEGIRQVPAERFFQYLWRGLMAAARFCMSRSRIGAEPAFSRWSDRSLRAAGRMQRGWTGGAFTAGIAVAAAREFDSWTAAAAPAPADPFVPSDQKPGISKENVHVGGCKAGEWFQVPELSLRDHYFVVPLDHGNPDGSSITIFVREVVGVGKENKLLPCLLFLQGGPGFECARPTEAGGWVKKACEEYRVILLDQRGTGLSTPLTTSALAQFASPKQQAAYLRNFRADSIVKDAEIVRSYLVPDGEPWSVLGQSYGGFCAVTYLSMAPHGLHHVLLTGGLPPIDDGCTAEAVYRACYKRVAFQNAKYYKRFPGDVEIVRSVVLHLAQSEGGGVPLPSGGFLTPRGLQLLGLSGLGSSGGLERLHYIFERAWDPILVEGAKRTLSYNFLRSIDNWFDFDTNPLYAIMHESIYCQGAASKWAAHRVREELGDQFDAVKAASNSVQVLFTGEMIFPWMFDDMAALRPLKEAANILAETTDWPPLYNKKQLNDNKVPVAAAVYYEDLYVNVALSEETAAQIKDIRVWVTNEYLHSGIREDGARVLDQLFGMLKGKYPIR